jgi:hypothetical protein
VGDLLIKLQEEKRAKEKKEQAQEEEHKVRLVSSSTFAVTN